MRGRTHLKGWNPMTTDYLNFMPAAGVATLIRQRQISPVDAVEAALQRLTAVEPQINAFVTVTAEHARAEARRAEAAVMHGAALGPLHGVPITIKDFIETADVRTTYGSRVHANNIPKRDSIVVQRVRSAGAIMIGKTTGPDHGWKPLGDSPLTGVTRNPWALEYTPGGSSSGGAAGVAAGVAPIAVGSDGAGSIRIPASFCGIFGIKPSYGRVPHPGQSPAANSCIGPMSRTVLDAAILLKALAGSYAGDPATLESDPADYPALLGSGVAGRRFAWSVDLGFARRVDPEVRDICQRATQAFVTAGASVEAATPAWGDLKSIIDDIWPASWVGRIGHLLPDWEEQMDPGLVACIKAGLEQPRGTFVRAQTRRIAFAEIAHRFFENFDFLLTPTVAVPALKVGLLVPEDWEPHAWDWMQWAPFSFPFNFSWQPAATVPAGFTAGGLPVGLQIVGRRFDDLGVLQAAAAFESLRPWAHLKPVLPAIDD